MFYLKEESPIINMYLLSIYCLLFSSVNSDIEAAYPTPAFADVSSFVFTVVIVPVAVVNKNRQTVFTVVVVWVTCEERREVVQVLILSAATPK